MVLSYVNYFDKWTVQISTHGSEHIGLLSVIQLLTVSRVTCHSLRRRVERLRRSVYPPQNGAIVRTDSVRTKAYLQNSETCTRNLHWQVFVLQKMHEKFQALVREILVLLYIRN